MPPLEEDDCWQTAVLWPVTSIDFQGQPVVGDPIELKYPCGVRWLNKRSQVMDPIGNLISLDATAIVLQDIEIGSHMWLGALDDWIGTGCPNKDHELMVVKTFDKTPDLKDRFERRTVGLLRLHQ